MGMGEEQDRSYEEPEKAYIATPPATKPADEELYVTAKIGPLPPSASERMAADLHWFEEQFAAEFPHIAPGSADYMLARYWYLAALSRAAEFEAEAVLGLNTEMELALARMREELG